MTHTELVVVWDTQPHGDAYFNDIQVQTAMRQHPTVGLMFPFNMVRKAVLGHVTGQAGEHPCINVMCGPTLPPFLESKQSWDNGHNLANVQRTGPWKFYAVPVESIMGEVLPPPEPDIPVTIPGAWETWAAMSRTRQQELVWWTLEATRVSIRGAARVERFNYFDEVFRVLGEQFGGMELVIVWLLWRYLDCQAFPTWLFPPEFQMDSNVKSREALIRKIGTALVDARPHVTAAEDALNIIVNTHLLATQMHVDAALLSGAVHTYFVNRSAYRPPFMQAFLTGDPDAVDRLLCAIQVLSPADEWDALTVVSEQLPLAARQRIFEDYGLDSGDQTFNLGSSKQAAMQRYDVDWTAFAGDENESRKRFCLGHGTDRLLCGSVVVKKELCTPPKKTARKSTLGPRRPWKLVLTLEPKRAADATQSVFMVKSIHITARGVEPLQAFDVEVENEHGWSMDTGVRFATEPAGWDICVEFEQYDSDKQTRVVVENPDADAEEDEEDDEDEEDEEDDED